MTTVMTRCIRGLVARRDQGATAVEYALIVALIAGVIVFTVTTIGQQLLPGLQAVIAGL